MGKSVEYYLQIWDIMMLTILRHTDIILVRGGHAMSINELLAEKKISKYRLWKESIQD